MPSRELKRPDGEEQNRTNTKTSSADETARQARAGRRERGGRAGGPGTPAGPVQRDIPTWRALVRGNVIMPQFSVTNKAPHRDRPVSYENQTMIPQS